MYRSTAAVGKLDAGESVAVDDQPCTAPSTMRTPYAVSRGVLVADRRRQGRSANSSADSRR